ncbi:MAG: hypothetical protein AAFV32_03535 [Myxococcota bacterium]
MRGGEKEVQSESAPLESNREVDAALPTDADADAAIGAATPADGVVRPVSETETSARAELIPSADGALEAGSSSDWKQQLEREYADLKRARDELRVKAHLARADIRDAWDELEARWPKVESSLKRFEGQATQALDEFGHATRTLFRELRRGYQRVKKDL